MFWYLVWESALWNQGDPWNSPQNQNKLFPLFLAFYQNYSVSSYLLKIKRIFVIHYSDVKLDLREKVPSCLQVFMIWKSVMEVTRQRKSHQLSFSEENPMNYKINLPIKCIHWCKHCSAVMVEINYSDWIWGPFYKNKLMPYKLMPVKYSKLKKSSRTKVL